MGKTVKVIKRSRDQQELTQAMVDASQKLERQKEDQKREQLNEMRRALGIDPKNNRSVLRGMVKLLIWPEKYKTVTCGIGSTVLLIAFLSGVFYLVEFFLYAAALYLPYKLIHAQLNPSHLIPFLPGSAGDIFILLFKAAGSLIVFCVPVYYARLFRMLRMEVEMMDDKDKLLALFSAIAAVAAVIQPIIYKSPK